MSLVNTCIMEVCILSLKTKETGLAASNEKPEF